MEWNGQYIYKPKRRPPSVSLSHSLSYALHPGLAGDGRYAKKRIRKTKFDLVDYHNWLHIAAIEKNILCIRF